MLGIEFKNHLKFMFGGKAFHTLKDPWLITLHIHLDEGRKNLFLRKKIIETNDRYFDALVT